jgi:hypothetical protein
MDRAGIDKIAWKVMHDQVPVQGDPPGLADSRRPSNFQELGDLMQQNDDFELSWSEFLHEFLRYKQVSFFAVPPPKVFSPGMRSMLAGAAEFMCTEFGLPIPEWVNEPEFTMPEPFEPYGWMYTGESEDDHQRRIAKAHPIFLKHNVVFASRNLITV